MLREEVERLDAIVFTHEHKDHVAGLDDIEHITFLAKSRCRFMLIKPLS